MKGMAACAGGALPKLSVLYLWANPLDNQGVQALTAVLHKGALPKLRSIWIEANPAPAEVRKALTDAVAAMQWQERVNL